jgi:hypothetical protein
MKQVVFAIILIYASHLSFGQAIEGSFYHHGLKAYQNNDYKTYLAQMRLADEALPNQVRVMTNLTKAYALNGRKSRAVQVLRKLILLNASYDFQNDPDLESIVGYKGYREIVNLQKLLLTPEENDEIFRTIESDSNHVESFVVLDNGDILLGSINRNKIIKVDQAGNLTDWLVLPYSVLGMKIDQTTGFLWVASAATKRMQDFNLLEMGKTFVIQIDIDNVSVIQGLEFNEAELFRDVVLDKKSQLWLTNSIRPYVSRDDTDTTFTIGAFMRKQFDLSATHFHLHGLTLNDDESVLYFGDYYVGIYKLNIAEDAIVKVQATKDFHLAGMSSLYYYNNSLITIQNGVRPLRVVQYFLDDEGENIIGQNYINRGGQSLGDPTYGQIKDGYFYYIANSPRSAYDVNLNLEIDKVNDIEIRRFKLR